MFEELFEEEGKKVSKDRLLEIVDNYDFSEEEGIIYLSSIICQVSCDEEVLKALIKKKETPFNSLDKYMIDNIGGVRIKDIDLFLYAIKRFKDNKYFMSAMKNNNVCYPEFLKKQAIEVKLFNDYLDQQIEKLKKANTLIAIKNIENLKQELAKKRTNLLEQYPEAALSDMSEFTNAVIAATIRVTSARSTTFTRFTPMFNTRFTESFSSDRTTSQPQGAERQPPANKFDIHVMRGIRDSVPF